MSFLQRTDRSMSILNAAFPKLIQRNAPKRKFSKKLESKISVLKKLPLISFRSRVMSPFYNLDSAQFLFKQNCTATTENIQSHLIFSQDQSSGNSFFQYLSIHPAPTGVLCTICNNLNRTFLICIIINIDKILRF